MQRKMDLIRQIAFLLEGQEDAVDTGDFGLEGFTSGEIQYHCELMAEAGLILAPDDLQTLDGSGLYVVRLTWAGHDFLDAARDQEVWNKVTKQVKERTVSVAFDGLVALLKKYGQQAIEQGWELVTSAVS